MSTASSLDTISTMTSDILFWWEGLEDQWKKAFNEAYFGQGPVTLTPSTEAIQNLLSAEALRFVGPGGPYPNLSFALTNLSGVTAFSKLKVLVANYHEIESIHDLSSLTSIESLFLHNNRIARLDDLMGLVSLRELYVQNNLIKSILPLRKLVKLQAVYVNDNLLESLQGITKRHSDVLKELYCLPNDELKQGEIIRVEQKLGIRCLRV